MNIAKPLLSALIVATTLASVLVSGPAVAESPKPPPEIADRDPRNWPTVNRLIADRYDVAGQVFALRVHARRANYFNCSYPRGAGLMSFTLLGGPFETLTGYMPNELGRILERLLEDDPWAPITVHVSFDPEHLSEFCPDQVDIIKFARGWQWPIGSVTPGRPDATLQPSGKSIDAFEQRELWDALFGKHKKGPDGEVQELQVGTRVTLTAGARTSTAYHCMFKGATRTHYALQLHNGRGRLLHGYVPKTDASRELVDYIALHRDVLVTVQGKVVKQTMSHYCRNQLAITGWELPKAKH